MLMPNGLQSLNMDPVMLLSTWAKHLHRENTSEKSMIFAGMGKPTYPIDIEVCKTMLNHWQQLYDKAILLEIINNNPDFSEQQKINEIKALDAAIDYGDAQGELPYRQKMAEALSSWYGEKINISAENILFTIGGAAAINMLFKVLKQNDPKKIYVTQFPYYSLYKKRNYDETHLFPILSMEQESFQLTATSLELGIIKATEKAIQEKTVVNGIIICNPNNPLGTVIPKSELKKIREVLLRYPNIKVILDEAYAEMDYSEQPYQSLLSECADFKDRFFVFRSATKGLSSAGERMAILMCFDNVIMNELVSESIANCGHAPISLQKAYAEAMSQLNSTKLDQINLYYKKQVEFVVQDLKRLNLYPKKPNYQVTGTFYVLADLSFLFGTPTTDMMKEVMGCNEFIETDEEIAFYLLFEEKIMLMPLSYFGLSKTQGYLRITCSGGFIELKDLLNRLEILLIKTRQAQTALASN